MLLFFTGRCLLLVSVMMQLLTLFVIRLISKLIFCNVLMMMIIIIYSGLFMTPSLAHNT
jgi:hypothetical protein